MRKLRILVLMHADLMPPVKTRGVRLATVKWKTEYDVVTTLRKMGHQVQALGVQNDLRVIQKAVEEWKPQIAFNLLEGFKDATLLEPNVVSYLELLAIPYTGCNPRGLMLARDKGLFKIILSYHRILSPEFAVFPVGGEVERPQSIEFPLIVKSISEEASLGISQASVVKDDHELRKRVAFIHHTLDTAAIAERYIEGRELYVGVLGYGQLEVLPVWELVLNKMPETARRFATDRVKWNRKYQKKYRIRSRQAEGLTEGMVGKIQCLAKQVYQILGLSGYARIDFRLDPMDNIYVLEANPNPQIARREDLADSAKRAGLPYEMLLQRILDIGLC